MLPAVTVQVDSVSDAILLLNEPGLSPHGLKQQEFLTRSVWLARLRMAAPPARTGLSSRSRSASPHSRAGASDAELFDSPIGSACRSKLT
jgi:hypothetical protein